MKFEIDIDNKDFEAFLRHATKRMQNTSPVKERVFLFTIFNSILLAFIAVNFIVGVAFSNSKSIKSFTAGFAGVVAWGVGIGVWTHIFPTLIAKNFVSNKGSTIGKWELEFTDEYILQHKKGCMHKISWEYIESAEKHENLIFLYMDGNKALILPIDQISLSAENFIEDKCRISA